MQFMNTVNTFMDQLLGLIFNWYLLMELILLGNRIFKKISLNDKKFCTVLNRSTGFLMVNSNCTKNINDSRGTRMAQWVEHAILDVRVISSGPMLGVERT